MARTEEGAAAGPAVGCAERFDEVLARRLEFLVQSEGDG